MRLGLDTGYGHTKYAYFDEAGEIKLGKFPSVVASTNDDVSDLSMGVYCENDETYYVGDLALKQSHTAIKEIVSYRDLEKYAPILLKETLRIEGIEDKVTQVACGLSPAHMSHIAAFKERLSSFELNGKTERFEVVLYPQGVGAVKTINYLTNKGKLASMQGVQDYLIVDIGFNTTDIIFIYDGVVQKGKISSSNSFEKKGAINIAEFMQKHIKETYKREITLKEALGIVTKGSYRLRGETFDLSKEIETFKKRYTVELMNFLEERYGNEFDKLEKVCFVGGGGYFIDPDYARNIETFKISEYYNAIGNLVG